VPFFKEVLQVGAKNKTTLSLRHYQVDFGELESLSALL
jgi:hypothetical protein